MQGNTIGKIVGGCGCIVGAGGFALGMLAVFAPDIFAPLEDSVFDPVERSINTPMGEKVFFLGLMAFFVIVMGLAFSPLILGYLKKRKMRARLKMMGQKGEATILSVQDTGITINNDPYIKIFVEIHGTRAEISTTVSRVGIPRAGDVIKVVYDPSDPTVVLPEFEMN